MQLKKEVQDIRKSGRRITDGDLQRLEERFNKLDRSLQVIKAAPMEFEV